MISRPVYAISYIKPMLSVKRFDQENLFLQIEQNIAFLLTLFMNKVQELESIKSDDLFLTKYSRLWWLFIRGTLFLDHIFEKYNTIGKARDARRYLEHKDYYASEENGEREENMALATVFLRH
jgi:hypothetical protein